MNKNTLLAFFLAIGFLGLFLNIFLDVLRLFRFCKPRNELTSRKYKAL